MKNIFFFVILLTWSSAHATIFRVDVDATGVSNGTSWANAFDDLQGALAVANNGDEIWVAEGTYTPTSTNSRSIYFSVPDGVNIYGGFVGTETQRFQRNWANNPTIISGDIGVIADDTDNSMVLLFFDLFVDATVDGFVISDAYSLFDAQQGSAISVQANSNVRIEHCTIKNNTSYQGPALRNFGDVYFENCLIRDNTTDSGGIIDAGSGLVNTELVNCTLVDNNFVEPFAIVFGGYSSFNSYASYILKNTICWGHNRDIFSSQADLSIANCLFENVPVGVDEGSYISEDPLFTNPSVNDFTLQFLSPARNAGEGYHATHTNDLKQNNRTYDGSMDIGCYESQESSIIYVDIDANGTNNGSSWTNAFEDLQDALAVAIPGKEIWVAEGIYKPTTSTNRNISFEIPGNVKVFGGFTGTESLQNERDWNLYPTILSGAIGSLADITDNSKVVVSIQDEVGDVLLDGFHIRRAYHSLSSGVGAPIYIDNSSLILRRCQIYDNECFNSSGLRSCAGEVIIDNCLFHSNHDPSAVEGILIGNNCSTIMEIFGTTISNNTFTSNSVFIAEGPSGSSLNLYNSIIWDNEGASIDEVMNIDAEYSIIEGDFDGLHILNEDPQFTNPTIDDYTISFTSPARNEGNDARNNLTFDMNNQDRIYDGTLDLGCFELQENGVRYVNESAVGLNNGTSWTNAFTDLQSALTGIQPGFEIWVAEGTYKPTTGTSRSAKFSIPANIDLYGGFEGVETKRRQRNWNLFPTILSGAIGSSGETDNSYQLLVSTSAEGIVIDGFDIRKAYNEVSNGAALTFSNGSCTIRHCSIHDNFAIQGSAFMGGSFEETIFFEDCLFYDNQCNIDGVFSTGVSNAGLNLINCTVTRNSSLNGTIFGGANGKIFYLNNTIVWNHDDVMFETGSIVHASHSLLEELGSLSLTTAINLIDENPKFKSPASNDFTLTLVSPAINAGDNDLSANNNDLASNERIFDQVVDIGCFENNLSPILFVKENAFLSIEDGSSWFNAYKNLQDALTNAVEGQQIWVAQGVYKPTLGVSRSESFFLKHDVPMYGGFVGNETSIDQRDYQVNFTYLSGNINNTSSSSDNSYHVIRVNDVNADVVMDGFVVTSGFANSIGNDEYGGAIFIENAKSASINNTWIFVNYSNSHNVWVKSTLDGASFVNCIFQANTSNSAGAAIGYDSDIFVENGAFTDNSCIQGIVFQNHAAAEIDMRGCTFYDNSLNTSQSTYSIIKGVNNSNALKGQVKNTILWGNTMNASAKSIDGGTTTLFDVDYCILQGSEISSFNAGENVFYTDPLFTDVSTLDLALQPGSKGLNGGDNSLVTTSLDLIRNTRIQYGNVDMGCIESNVCSRPNDHCFQAIEIVVNADALNEGNICATSSGEIAGSCAASIGKSVWYTFQAQPGFTYEISLENVVPTTATFNPRIEFYSGDCDLLTQLDCVDQNGSGAGETLVADTLSSSLNYYIRVSGIVSQEGNFDISISGFEPCTGDLDHNGLVGIADLLIFNSNYGCTSNCGEADLDGNGSVSVSDLLIFNSVYGTVCP